MLAAFKSVREYLSPVLQHSAFLEKGQVRIYCISGAKHECVCILFYTESPFASRAAADSG